MKQIIFSICILLPSMGSVAQATWDFPVKPGTEEWRVIETRTEIDSLCIIPKEILKQLSTDELLDICLKYPLLIDLMAFNSAQTGFDVLCSHFNGFEEFLERQDCAKILIERYEQTDPFAYQDSWAGHQRVRFKLKTMVVEVMMAQQEVINKIEPDRKKSLTNSLLQMRYGKTDRDMYGPYSHMTIYYAISRILISEKSTLTLTDSQEKDLEEFARSASFNPTSLVPQITEIAEQYVISN